MPNLTQTTKPENLLTSDILKLYEFNFIERGFASFMHSLQTKFRKYREDFPVYIFNTGDEVYMLDWKATDGLGKTYKVGDIYQSKPRLEIKIDDLQINSDQLTNPFVEGVFTIPVEKRDTTFYGQVKRIPVTYTVTATLVCDSLLHSFKYTELLLTMMYRSNSFEFWHAKRRHQGVYFIQDSLPTEKTVEMGFSADSRDWRLGLTINVNMQFPAFDFFNASNQSIRPITTGVLKDVEFNLEVGDYGPGEGTVNETASETFFNEPDNTLNGDEQVGNVHSPSILPGYNPDGSLKTGKEGQVDGSNGAGVDGDSKTSTGWKRTANTSELSSRVLPEAETNQFGITTHYPM